MSGLSGKSVLEKSGSQTGSRSKFRTLNINSVYSGKSLLSSRSNVSSKHGLQSLGKATAIARRMPPPANLPSLKSESAGQDPAVSIVPSGVSGWGSQQADPTKNAPLTVGQRAPQSPPFPPTYTMRNAQPPFNASPGYHQTSNYPALTLPPAQYVGQGMPYLQRTMPPWDLKRSETPTATILKPRNQAIADNRSSKSLSTAEHSGRLFSKAGEAMSMWNSSRRSESSPSGTSCSRETAKDYLYHADNWVLNEYAHEQRSIAQSCDR
ncbi:BAT2 N domain containing protein [Trichuris trichiura]|uniref:BAT2 N domain containing protein n=1 Tax=Trichuris trichiura TaxID=36087 RepID=A0A077ZGI3_TRITR|nr:BAT2 N domain containing protein [Trichuris trichiura]